MVRQLTNRVKNLPERGDYFRGLRILHDVATEHQAINAGAKLADPGQHVVKIAAPRAPQQQHGYRRVFSDF
jgi:hypothetical protein